MDRDAAETLALKGLARIASDEDLLSAFLAATGIDPADLRARAGDSEVLAAVMDFLLADEGRLIAFCEDEGIKPERARAIRQALPGWFDG